MAATAYAALVSLLNTMDQIQIHPLLSNSFNNYPIKSLRQKIDLFLDFVEKFSSDADSCGEAEELVRRIAVVAREAEDIIEVHASRAVKPSKLKKVVAHQSQTFLSSLQRIIDDMDSIEEQIIKETGNHHQLLLLPPASSSSSSSVEKPNSTSDELSPSLLPDKHDTKEDMDSINKKVIKAKEETGSSAKTTNMMGFDGYLEQLLDQLTRQHSGSRQILPIVGMGGIGKTTLARNVYDNSLIVEHFDVRVWVTVSQQFSVSEILLQALSCLGGSNSNIDTADGEIGEELHKILCGRRYLIVLDDIWSVKAWDKIKSFFPKDNNGSRIVITTRQSELVGYFGSSSLAVDFLDDKNSWELFCEKTFAQEGCPPELEDVGHKIVRKCRGLPLAIVVVGGLLGKSPRTLEYWEEIEKDKSLILDSEEGNNASGILYLSYKHMPVWLKPCFLYFGLFPEDYHINVSQLIVLWVAEGFIKSNTDQSLEEVAENYVNELIDRNLVLVGGLRLNKKPKTCLVHDLVRDLCLRIAEKDNFYWAQRGIDGIHHYIVDERTARSFNRDNIGTPSLVEPLQFIGQSPEPSNSRLLRVVFCDADRLLGRNQIEEFNLRLFNNKSAYLMPEIPSSLSLLWSLQTLLVTRLVSVPAPSEIWEMPQLRHIKIKQSVRLPPPPPPPSDDDDVSVLRNLQTFVTVENLILSEEVCKRIPNIKKLGIQYNAQFEGESCHLHNVEFFNKLESLRFCCWGWENAGDSFRNLRLPSSLKKLILQSCKLVWSDVAMIGSLPHLQTLELLNNAVVGVEWSCVEGEFPCLKYLRICDCGDLTYWIADSSSVFPALEKLVLQDLPKLEEIPSGIGDVPTLESIGMFKCSESANFSAVKILEEQEDLANMGLEVRIMFDYKSEAEKLREEIQELGITCQNLHIFDGDKCYYVRRDRRNEEEDLVRRIAVVTHEAEDIIEVHAARAAAAASTRNYRKLKKLATPPFSVFKFTQQSQIFFPNLQRIIDDMDSITEQIIMIQDETATSSIPPASSFSATAMVENNSEAVALEADEIVHLQPADPIFDEQSPSLLPDMQNKVIKSSSSLANTTNMVGFDGYLEQLLDQLTRQHSGGRQILPIVGMGGIGKTMLARNVYDNLLTVEHFYVRAWVTVSQEFSVNEILLQALSCLGRSTSKNDRTDGLLGEELHKILYGRRYLIVLDDVWSIEAWDKMKSFFPENNNRRRIVITTRQTELVG